ncbi:MAG: SDR family NAD(P)-dependent oxidoreductase [Promethearchaeota archaeon]|nr:MAG: SDR family NAD(P)-dependent oxidoreductase [Candidatus Lokiarchaeota archaeon]
MGYLDRNVKKVKGKSIIICGGSKGIGKETAKLFAKLGANILIIARNLDALEETKEECLQNAIVEDQEIEIQSCDCTDFDSLHPIIENYISKNGAPDFLINVVGYAHAQYVEKLSITDFKKNFETNYYGQLVPTMIVIPHMMKEKKGQIAFVSSVMGYMGFLGFASYSPSKFALVGLAECLRNELKPYNIPISVLYPSDTDTPGLKIENSTKPHECSVISGNAKLLQPDEVAKFFVKGILKKKFNIMNGEVKLYWWIKRIAPRLVFSFIDADLKKARKEMGKSIK